jgi:ComF family protein
VVSLNPLFQAWRACADSLPGQCAVCFSWSRGRICSPCLSRFAAPTWRCQRCALRVPDSVTVCGACIKKPPLFDAALASVDYGHPWDQLIARFKFNAALDLSSAFADLMVRTHRASSHALSDLLLPVPLSAQRLRERGYNQAWELARRTGRQLQVKADAHLLLRVKDTPHQLAFPPAKRAANVRGAFAVEPRRLSELRGKRVTVIDDVMTTGATANEIAAVLRQAGATEVHFWVIARTPRPGE